MNRLPDPLYELSLVVIYTLLVISCALLPAVIWQMVFHPLWTVTQ